MIHATCIINDGHTGPAELLYRTKDRIKIIYGIITIDDIYRMYIYLQSIMFKIGHLVSDIRFYASLY